MEIRDPAAKQLIDALVQGKFVLFCQPIVSIASSAADYRYVEIFVRYREEEEKLLAPGAFLPILEANRLMEVLDRWVVRQVLNWMREKQDLQPDWNIARCSINLAADSLRDPNFPLSVRDQLAECAMPGDRLSFEVPARHANAYPGALMKMASALNESKCSVTVSGFAGSKAVARRYRDSGVQAVKIEGTIVRNVHKDSSAFANTKKINACCHELGMLTIAELVEERQTWEILRELGVDFVQGFAIAEPVPLMQAP